MASNRLKIYTDEHIPRAASEGLRRRGIDVLRAQDVIFTQDADFLRLHKKGISHSGIVFAHQHVSIRNMIQGLILLYEMLTCEDMMNHVEFL